MEINPTSLRSVDRAQIFVPASYLLSREIVWLIALTAATLGFVFKTHAGVTESWVQRYSNVVSNSVDTAFKVVSDPAGDIIVTGVTDNNISQHDILTIKYSGTDGSVLWTRRYNSPANGDDFVSGLSLDSTGNVVVVGSSVFNLPDFDSEWPWWQGEYYFARYAAATGAILWEKRRPATGGWWTGLLPAFVAVDNNNDDVVVTLPSWVDRNANSYTAKFAALDGALLWEKRHGEPSAEVDAPIGLAVDGSGNVLVIGKSDILNVPGFYTLKYSPHGALLWENRTAQARDNYFGSPKALAVDRSGDVVVTVAFHNPTNLDYETTKYATADGAILWTQRYNGSSNRNDSPTALAVDHSGNVVVTGFVNRSDRSDVSDLYTVKYAAADGAILWEKLQKSRGNGNATHTIVVDNSEDVIIAGTSNYDYHTTKYRARDGALLWEMRYNGPGKRDNGDYLEAIVIDPSGNVVVTGTSDYSFYTMKYSGDSALLWGQRHSGPANRNDYAAAVAIDRSGNVIVTGSSEKDAVPGDYSADDYTARYRLDGMLLWSRRHPGSDRPQALAVDGSNNVVVSGSSYSSGPSVLPNCYTTKYTTDGALLWEQRYLGFGRGSEIHALAIDGTGDVFITGSVSLASSRSNADYYTAKYAAATGALLWEKRYGGPASLDDRALAMALDSDGNVVVTGQSGSSERLRNPVFDFYTAKYAGTTGALLWEQRYNGPAKGDDEAADIAIDRAGNVIVTGRSARSVSEIGFVYDSYTAKYARKDGHLIWEKRYNGPGGAFGEGIAVATDANDDVVVAGYAANGLSITKYAGADGLLLWEEHGRFGVPRALRITERGNIVVAGDGYYTASYAGEDGALLWDKHYNGPANNENFVSGLALGPAGMVAVTGSSEGNLAWRERFFDYATVVYREGLSALSIELVGSGVRLSFTGVANQIYALERGPAITGPWTTVDSKTGPSSGLIQFEDESRATTKAFYRTTVAITPE